MSAVPFQLAQNDIKSISNPSRITAIGGDNATEFYINFPWFPPGSQWVFPFTYGFMYVNDSPYGGQAINVDASKTPPGFQSAVNSSKVAMLAAYDTPQTFNPGITALPSSQLATPIFFQATIASAGTTASIAAILGKTITVFDIYTMFDAPSVTPAGGFQFQDTSGASFACVSCGVVNPDPLHFGPQGSKLPIGLGTQFLNNSGGTVTARGCIVYSQG